MSRPEILTALLPVVEVLETLGIRYYVGGSVASAVYGVPRATLDVDLVAEIVDSQVQPFVERLLDAYYLDEHRVQSAVALRRSFNLIHLDTMVKVDVFVSKARPFDIEAFRRARAETLTEDPAERAVSLASPEDVVLAKLEWYRKGGQMSERQWSDVLGVLKLQDAALDRDYLRRWAASLGVADLLLRALEEGGLADD